MKTILSTIFLATLGFANAQEIKDYKYVHVPDALSSFGENQYQLNSRLGFYLGKKNYTILKDDKSVWPAEALNDPCTMVRADLVKAKSLTTNKLNVNFIDCKNQIISSIEGSSIIKEFDKGYQDALKRALDKIEPSVPTVKSTKSMVASQPINTQLIKQEPVQITVKASDNANVAPLLTDGKKNYQLIELNQNSFIIMNENATQVVSKFEKTLKPGVFRVAVTNGDSTYNSIGYYNENSISFEVKENNVWKEVILTEKK
ncbi:MAG: hypothetical protein KIG88_12345 [Weeksellaceae bacterium]|nr:hypothetical protein [Weeksellaceae bacterium]